MGHVAVARAATVALDLDGVLFCPVGSQPLKPVGATASYEDRVAMTRLALTDDPRFAVSLLDAPKPASAPNYTYDTLLHLRDEIPSDGELFCLMGADSFLSLRRWYRAAEIPFVAPLIVASRPGQRLDSLTSALPEGLRMETADGSRSIAQHLGKPDAGQPDFELRFCRLRNPAGEASPLYLLEGLHLDISASTIRRRIHGSIARKPASNLESKPRSKSGSQQQSETAAQQVLYPAVLDYIRSHRLYR